VRSPGPLHTARLSFLILVLLALAALAVAPPASHAAVPFGSDLSRPVEIDEGCDDRSTTCTRMLLSAGGGEAVAPIDGVIVRWRLIGAGTVRLRVVRRDGETWSTGGSSAPATLPLDRSTRGTFPTRLPVRAGDFLAVDGNRENHVHMAYDPGVVQAHYFYPVFQDGETLRVPITRLAPDPFEPLVGADVEPDADGDGFGDETQDCAPANPAVQTGCGTTPEPPGPGPGPVTPVPTTPTTPTTPGPATPTTPAGGTPSTPVTPVVETFVPTGPAGAPVAPAPAAARRCVVPRLRGATVAKAKAALRRAACRAGAVRRVQGRGVKRGRVLSQSRRAGRSLPAGARVDLRVRR
jgi:hypothetical protein